MAEEEGEEEVLLELEALQSVYGDDCVVIDSYPPSFHLHIKPRTADVSSEQFVEAIIGIRAGSKYPEEPPDIHIVESKGLDEQRQNDLLSSMQDKASELSSCSMLVALCEEAVERLSSMNHPDGDCPLCLDPLVEDYANNKRLPFMKLMSCYHCFHRECIIRWWNWLQSQDENQRNSSGASSRALRHVGSAQGKNEAVKESTGSCPVCRKTVHAKDIEHVLDLVEAHSEKNVVRDEVNKAEEVLQSDSEKSRKQKFEAILKLQQENSGLIEPKKNEVLLPGMFLPRPISEPTTTTTSSANETTAAPPPPQQDTTAIPGAAKPSSSYSKPQTSQNKNPKPRANLVHVKTSSATSSAEETTAAPPPQQDAAAILGTAKPSSSSSKPRTSENRNPKPRTSENKNPSTRKPQRGRSSINQPRQWVRKENGNAE